MAISSFLTEENLQRLLNQQITDDQGVAGLLPSNVSPFFRMDATGGVVPRLALEPLYPNFGAPMIEDEYYSPKTPLLESNIPTIQNPVANEDDEEDLTGLFAEGTTTGIPSFGSTEKAPTAFGTMGRKGGIADLLRTVIGFAVPGAGLFMGGLDGIRSLNQRLQGSTFGQSRSMQEFLERKRNERLGNVDSTGMGLSRSELVQRNFADRVRDLSSAGDDDTGGGGGGSQTQRDAGPGFTGGGTAAEMGSF